jgi:hypothetical protein
MRAMVTPWCEKQNQAIAARNGLKMDAIRIKQESENIELTADV